MVTIPGSSTLDRVRKEVERNALRARNGIGMATGLKRTDVGMSPKDTVWSSGRAELWRYRSDEVSLKPPLLIIYSLFNQSYILDLRPGNSVIERLVQAGFDVYMLDWGIPDERDAGNTLEDYVDYYIPAAIDRIREISDTDQINLFGYCFGGTLAMLHAAHHPESPLRSLTVLTTPADLQQCGPMTDLMARTDLEDIIGKDGLVPPGVIMQGFRTLEPVGEVTTRVDLLEKLWNDDFVTAYQAMTGWATDQVPLPGGVARQFKKLVVENGFLKDRIYLGGDRVRLKDITVPFMHVLGKRDHIIPEASASPLVDLVGSEERQDMVLDAGHVGLMVGRTAHKNTVPVVIDFLKKRSESVA